MSQAKNAGPSFAAVWWRSAKALACFLARASAGACKNLSWPQAKTWRLSAKATLWLGFLAAIWMFSPWVGAWSLDKVKNDPSTEYRATIRVAPLPTPSQWAALFAEYGGDSDRLDCLKDALSQQAGKPWLGLAGKCEDNVLLVAAARWSQWEKMVASPSDQEPKEERERLEAQIQEAWDQRMALKLAHRLRLGEPLDQAARAAQKEMEQEQLQDKKERESQLEAAAKESLAAKDKRPDPELEKYEKLGRAALAFEQSTLGLERAQIPPGMLRQAMLPWTRWSANWMDGPLKAVAASDELFWRMRWLGLSVLFAVALLALLAWQLCVVVLMPMGRALGRATQRRREAMFVDWEADQMAKTAKKSASSTSKRL